MGETREEWKEFPDAVTRTAHALWNGLWAVAAQSETSMEELGQGRYVESITLFYAQKYGPYRERKLKAVKALLAWYREMFGEDGEAKAKEYYQAQQNQILTPNDPAHPARARFAAAEQALAELHDGVHVASWKLMRVEAETSEPG